MKEITATAQVVTLKRYAFHVGDDWEATEDSVAELVCDTLNGEFSDFDWHDTFESAGVRLYRDSDDFSTVVRDLDFEVEPIR